jgi:HAD superfamily hydrolase (TIGR01509 family)
MFHGKKVMIFDVDGTLIDSVGVWNAVDQELVRRLGGGEQNGDALQHQRDELLRRFAADSDPYGKYCAFLKEKYGTDLSVDEVHSLRYSIARHYLVSVVDYKPGADLFVRELKARGFRLSVATTTRRGTVDIYRTLNRNILNKAPIDEFFSPVYTREDVSRMKPDPEVYFMVMRETGAAPEECLIFEDSLIGIESAKNAGIQAAAVYDRYSDGEREKINELADWRINDYAQALEKLRSEMA